MTRITATSGSFATQFDTVFSAVIASCAEFCGEARQGRDIEARYQTPNRCSGPDLAAARTALTDTRH